MSTAPGDVERVARISAVALHKELSAAIYAAITSGDDNTSRVARNIAHDMVRRISAIRDAASKVCIDEAKKLRPGCELGESMASIHKSRGGYETATECASAIRELPLTTEPAR